MPRAFLLMPFRSEFDDLKQIIVDAGSAVGVEVLRADDIFAGGVIVDQVRAQIHQADIVIAVCTDRNPNVFFELGLADMHHRPILVAKERDDLPFDIQHWRAHFYGGPGPADRMDTLRSRLIRAIEETMREPRPMGDPPTDSSGRIVSRRRAVAERARDIVGAMGTYAPGDIGKAADELEPLLRDYFLAIAPLICVEGQAAFQDEVRAFASWTDAELAPDSGYTTWIEVPRWLVWWIATTCGMYAASTECWTAIDVLSEQTCYVRNGRYPRLTLLDSGEAGEAIGSSRFKTDLERRQYGRDAAAAELVLYLSADQITRTSLLDFAATERQLRTSLAVYRFVSVLRSIADGSPPSDWPWLHSLPHLHRFIERVARDRPYRQRLAERLFGRSVEGFEMLAPQWFEEVRRGLGGYAAEMPQFAGFS